MTGIAPTVYVGGGEELSTGIRLAAPGVNDSEKQLSSEDLIQFKQRLKDEPWLIDEACGYIAAKLTTSPATEPYIGEFESMSKFEVAREAGGLAVHWARALQEAITLPGDEWPEGMSAPATFNEAIKEANKLDIEAETVDG